jgi:HAD superfamily hydrolase (TIGR01509 family)
MNTVPYAEIETLFLDAGNTLICMDYDWISAELKSLGVEATAASLQRAEAASRPATSARLAGAKSGDNYDLFEFHLTQMLDRLGEADSRAEGGVSALAKQLSGRLKKPGQDYRLWSWVLPGVRDALRTLQSLGLRLVVVSNSDGSVERALRMLGIAAHMNAIFDSHVVGFEKPDPRFFEHALHRSGAEPGRTAHVGDMYYQDVIGSRAAGLHSVLLDPFDDWQVEDCVRCRDLNELAGRIAGVRLSSELV